MKSLLVREQVDGSTVLSTKTKYIQGHSTKLLLPEGHYGVNISIIENSLPRPGFEPRSLR